MNAISTGSPRHTHGFSLIACLAVGLGVLGVGVDRAIGQEDRPLTIADLDEYRRALRADEPGDPAPEPVSFVTLWERPEEFLGRRVSVEGKAARRFRQGAIGEYPPLVELWIATRTGNPTCLVYPEPTGGDPTPLGATVRFAGTFQKRVRYEAGDEPRIAPLVVGPEAPTVLRGPARGAWQPIGPFRPVDWMVGAIVAAGVVSVIVRQVLMRPGRPRRALREAIEGPPPEFEDGPAELTDPYDSGGDRPEGDRSP